MDIARHILFRPVFKEDDIQRHFFKADFANKCLDDINIINILYYKRFQSKIPPYFTDKLHSIYLLYMYLYQVCCIHNFQLQGGFAVLQY